MPSMFTTYTFNTGEVIDSLQMNTNFNDVKAAYNANAVQVDGSVQATTASLGNSIVTGPKIANDAIVNANINPSAGISFSKMADRVDWTVLNCTFNAGSGVDSGQSTVRYKIIDKMCFIKGVITSTSTAGNMLTTITGLPVAPKLFDYGAFLGGTAMQKLYATSSFLLYPVSIFNNILGVNYTTVAFAEQKCVWSFDVCYEIA